MRVATLDIDSPVLLVEVAEEGVLEERILIFREGELSPEVSDLLGKLLAHL